VFAQSIPLSFDCLKCFDPGGSILLSFFPKFSVSNSLFSMSSITLEKEASTDVLGSAAKVVITKNSTLLGADGSIREAIGNRVNQIKKLIENTIIQQSSSIYIFLSIPSLSLKQPGLRSPPSMAKKPPDRHVLGLFWLAPSKKREIQILKHVSGIVKPSRMTLLLCPPGSGKKNIYSSTCRKT